MKALPALSQIRPAAVREIVVVDDASTDDTSTVAAEAYGAIVLRPRRTAVPAAARATQAVARRRWRGIIMRPLRRRRDAVCRARPPSGGSVARSVRGRVLASRRSSAPLRSPRTRDTGWCPSTENAAATTLISRRNPKASTFWGLVGGAIRRMRVHVAGIGGGLDCRARFPRAVDPRCAIERLGFSPAPPLWLLASGWIGRSREPTSSGGDCCPSFETDVARRAPFPGHWLILTGRRAGDDLNAEVGSTCRRRSRSRLVALLGIAVSPLRAELLWIAVGAIQQWL